MKSVRESCRILRMAVAKSNLSRNFESRPGNRGASTRLSIIGKCDGPCLTCGDSATAMRTGDGGAATPRNRASAGGGPGKGPNCPVDGAASNCQEIDGRTPTASIGDPKAGIYQVSGRYL